MSTDKDIEHGLRRDLRTATAQPPPGPSLERTLRAGRSRRRRQTVGRVAGGVLLSAALVAAAAVAWPTADRSADSPAEQPQWATSVPPEDMNDRIAELIREQLPPGTEVTEVEMAAWGPYPEPPPGEPYDGDVNTRLPRERWDEAVSWEVTMQLGDGHDVSVSLLHAASETEGDAGQVCAQDLRQNIYLRCDVAVDQASGLLTVSRVAALTRDGIGWATVDPQEADPDQLWFERAFEVRPGGDFLIRVIEKAKSPTRQAAEKRLVLDDAAMAAIGLHSDLVEPG